MGLYTWLTKIFLCDCCSFIGCSHESRQQSIRQTGLQGLYETTVMPENVRSAHWHDLHHNNKAFLAIRQRESKGCNFPYDLLPLGLWRCRQPAHYNREQTQTYSENVAKTSIQRIIGRRCRFTGCFTQRPQERIWCILNDKWRWVISALLDIMIVPFGKAVQPGEGDGMNVSMQTKMRMIFGVSCAPALLLWFSIYSGSPGINLMMLPSARHHLVHV